MVASAGAAAYRQQRASLAGTRGTMVEVGNVHAAWRSGRVAVEAGGTVLRLFEDREVLTPPHGGARAQAEGGRRDTGDFRVATALRLTPERTPLQAVLRFGTRLPTTDNEVGLERDRTDFFALLATRWAHPRARLFAEAGVSINGTREDGFEQADVLAFAAGAELPLPLASPALLLVGHLDGFDGYAIRGNEELAELRLRLRTHGRYWVEAQAVRGLAEFSPAAGLLLSVGTTR